MHWLTASTRTWNYKSEQNTSVAMRSWSVCYSPFSETWLMAWYLSTNWIVQYCVEVSSALSQYLFPQTHDAVTTALCSVSSPHTTWHQSISSGKFPNPQFDICVWQPTAPVFSDWNCPVPSPCSAWSTYQEISWTIVAISSPNPNRIFIQNDVTPSSCVEEKMKLDAWFFKENYLAINQYKMSADPPIGF